MHDASILEHHMYGREGIANDAGEWKSNQLKVGGGLALNAAP